MSQAVALCHRLWKGCGPQPALPDRRPELDPVRGQAPVLSCSTPRRVEHSGPFAIRCNHAQMYEIFCKCKLRLHKGLQKPSPNPLPFGEECST
jgi:hypothetical protein